MTDILSWLSARMAAPRPVQPKEARRCARTAKQFRIAADYLAGTPMKMVIHNAGLHRTVVYKIIDEFGLPRRQPRRKEAANAMRGEPT